MKKIVVLLALLFVASVTVGAEKKATKAVKKGYQGWGMGGGLSFVVPDNGWGVHFVNQNAAIGAEFKVAARFSLGKGGKLHYAPTVGWWGRLDSWGDEAQHNYVDLYDWELNFNISDVRYFPPVPKDFAVKPYVGLGLLSFTIYKYKEEIGSQYDWVNSYDYYNGWYIDNRDGYYYENTSFHVAQTFTIGAEFELKSSMRPYTEFKLSNGNVSDFAITVGFTVLGKK
jgi:hypothetical protein